LKVKISQNLEHEHYPVVDDAGFLERDVDHISRLKVGRLMVLEDLDREEAIFVD
jgi:hypothetical protein